jgi:hypothetical protein
MAKKKRNCQNPVMASPEEVMSRDALEEFERRLKMLSPDSVERAYLTAYKNCAWDGRKLPQAASVQQLVAAWRVLRSMYRANAKSFLI